MCKLFLFPLLHPSVRSVSTAAADSVRSGGGGVPGPAGPVRSAWLGPGGPYARAWPGLQGGEARAPGSWGDCRSAYRFGGACFLSWAVYPGGPGPGSYVTYIFAFLLIHVYSAL